MTTSVAPPPRRHRLLDITEKILKVVAPVTISVLLVLWLLHKVDIYELKRVVRTECDFTFVALMMAITVLSHINRGLRWGIQLRGAGLPRLPKTVECVSIFGAYAMNLLMTGVGEAWRCVFMARRERAKLSTVVGTDIGDRSSDGAVIVLLTGLTLLVARPYMEKFMRHYSLGHRLSDLFGDIWLWVGIGLGVCAIYIVLRTMRRYKIVRKIDGSLDEMWRGFKILFTMPGRWTYLLLTFGIWGCYFMETYVMFYAFPFTRALVHDPGSACGLIPGLVVFVFGSFSMAIPSSGGLGPWNLAVMFALSLYGISETEGLAFSLVMWSCQAATLVALGIFSAIYIMTHKAPSQTSQKGNNYNF